MNKKVSYRSADYVADFIANRGIEHIFLLPGGGAMHLIDAVGKHPQLKTVACLHEQAAAIAAEAYGRVHPKGIGVAMVTTGPGATNAITAVAGAWIESLPLVIISGQVKRADLLLNSPLRQKGVQEVDIVSMIKPVTKYAKTVGSADDIRLELERAFYLAKEGRAGPVWLDIPLDVQSAQVDPSRLIGFMPPPELPNNSDNTQAIMQMLTMLKNAERPLVLAGHGIRLAGANQLFREIIEILQIPVVTTWNAMDLLPYDHPLCIGRPGVVALRAPNFAIQNCDLLISIGSRVDNIITAYNSSGFARCAKKIVVDVDANEINKLNMNIDLSVVADAHEFLQETRYLITKNDTLNCQNWRDSCHSWKERFSVNDGLPFPHSNEISHYQFADALSDSIPPNTLISTGSSGLAIEAFYTVFRNKEGQRIFLTSGLGAMGYGLPAAIGACFANHCKPMIAVESDGSLQLNMQELSTLRSFNLPICLFIMNNDGYCSIRGTQRNYFEGRYVGTGPETGLLLPDLKKLAAVYDLPYITITEPDRLHDFLNEALTLTRPCIIDVKLIKNESLTPKSIAIPKADGTMVSMPLEDMTPLLPIEVLEQEMLVPLLEISRKVRMEQ